MADMTDLPQPPLTEHRLPIELRPLTEKPTVGDFTEFVRVLLARRWTPIPVDPLTAGFSAMRVWDTGDTDTVVVFDLDRVAAHRHNADGAPLWTAEGDLFTLRTALALLPAPDSPGAPTTPLGPAVPMGGAL